MCNICNIIANAILSAYRGICYEVSKLHCLTEQFDIYYTSSILYKSPSPLHSILIIHPLVPSAGNHLRSVQLTVPCSQLCHPPCYLHGRVCSHYRATGELHQISLNTHFNNSVKILLVAAESKIHGPRYSICLLSHLKCFILIFFCLFFIYFVVLG